MHVWPCFNPFLRDSISGGGRRSCSAGCRSLPPHFVWWKIFFFSPPRVCRSLNLAWWVCLGGQCCADPGKSMFLSLQLGRKRKLFCFRQLPHLIWLICPLMLSLWQQVDVCVSSPVVQLCGLSYYTWPYFQSIVDFNRHSGQTSLLLHHYFSQPWWIY